MTSLPSSASSSSPINFGRPRPRPRRIWECVIAHGSLIACVSSPVESSVADFSTCGLISSSFIFSYISFPIGGIFKDEIPEYPFCPEILEVPKSYAVEWKCWQKTFTWASSVLFPMVIRSYCRRNTKSTNYKWKTKFLTAVLWLLKILIVRLFYVCTS